MTDEKQRPTVHDEKLDPKVIQITSCNRAFVADDAFKELKGSIEKDGVLNPVLVSVHTDEKDQSTYTLIAGERRLRACLALKLEEIPVRAYVVTDDEVAALRMVENVHRKNLGPLEEAIAFKAVADLWGDIKTAASAVGKSVAYVGRAISLLELTPKVKAFIGAGELTAAHGHQLLRCAEKQRDALSEWVTTKNDWTKRLPTVDELKAQIAAKAERDLAKALFPKEGEYGGKIACSGCQYNSGNQAALFDGATAGICSGPACFAHKEKTFYKEFEAKQAPKFEKMKALGVVADHGYMGNGGTAKGFPIMSDETVESKPVKKAMEEHPEAFGWCVIKPSAYSQKKKPYVAFVVVDAAVLPKGSKPPERGPERTQEDYERERKKSELFNGIRNLYVLRALDDEFDGAKPDMKHLVFIAGLVTNGLRDGGLVLSIIKPDATPKTAEDVAKILKKLDRADVLRFIWLASFGEYNLPEKAKRVGVDVKKVVGEADKVALAEWKKMLDTAEPKS